MYISNFKKLQEKNRVMVGFHLDPVSQKMELSMKTRKFAAFQNQWKCSVFSSVRDCVQKNALCVMLFWALRNRSRPLPVLSHLLPHASAISPASITSLATYKKAPLQSPLSRRCGLL